MNTNRIPQVFRGTILTVLLATSASLLGGCYVETRPAYAYEETTDATVVETAPPPDRVEVVGAAPYADGVWIKGNWRWTGREYAWAGGHWEHRRGNLAWHEGHYERHGRGYVYVAGRWG